MSQVRTEGTRQLLLVTLITAVVSFTLSIETSAAADGNDFATVALGRHLGPASPFAHPEIGSLVRRLRSRPGPEAVTLLRRLWNLWDRADPGQVEAALRLAAQRARLPPAAKHYAETLVAYARLRRGDAASARQRLAALGYVDRWLVVGPFDNAGKAGFGTPLGPERDLEGPLGLGRGYPGFEGRTVRLRELPEGMTPGWVNVGQAVSRGSHACAFLITHLRKRGLRSAAPATLWVGAAGAHRVYFNGVSVLEEPAYRGHDFDRRAVRVSLQPGDNRVLVKLCSAERRGLLSLRAAGPTGAPDPDLGWLPVAEGTPAAPAPPPTQRGLDAPLDAFERLLAASPNQPRLQYQFAQYLTQTDGDDPARHQARDLAVAAAQGDSSLRHWLLASRLGSDRNEEWLYLEAAKRALEARPVEPEDRAALAAAQAAWFERGFDPRRALPHYEAALRYDPFSLESFLGKVRALNAAGLPLSALALSAAARDTNPTAVSLLNLSASARQEAGQLAQAAGDARLYSAMRFDDPAPLLRRLDLAVARQEREAVEHWGQRLVEAHPQSLWLYSHVARAYRSLGQTERAQAVLERALALAPNRRQTLQALADLQGAEGRIDEQRYLLEQILRAEPQNRELRDYIQALAPTEPPLEEAYAWEPERFLKYRFEPAKGFHQRTLLDLTVNRVFDNGLSAQFRQVVFQPMTVTGAERARQFAFGYQADRQRAQVRAARVFRAAGGVDESFQSGEGPADSPELMMYTSAATRWVELPRLEPGDVVELRYRIDDVGQRGQFAEYYGDLHYFAWDQPVAAAEYYVVTPSGRPLFSDVQRLPEVTQQHFQASDGSEVLHFSVAGLPGYVAEPSMPPWLEVAGFIHVSTYPSYKEIGQWYWGLSKDQLRLDTTTRRLAQRLAAGHDTTLEKVRAVYGWVVRNTRYVALEFGIYGYKPRPCSQTVARGFGDCKDKATVLVGLLAELGIDATLVLVRTDQGGRMSSSVASLAAFDHAIAYVPELDLYLDGTAEWSGSQELPVMDQAALALRINRGDAQLVQLPDNDPDTHVVQRRVELSLAADGVAQLSLEQRARGPAAAAYRVRYGDPSAREARLLEDTRREFAGFELDPQPGAVQAGDLGDVESPAWVSVRGRVARAARGQGAVVALKVLPSVALERRYASLPERRFPVALSGVPRRVDEHVVELDASYVVGKLPENVEQDSPFGAYRVEATHVGQRVVLRSELLLKKTRVEPEAYAAFRDFCRAADAAFDQQLLLDQASVRDGEAP